MIVPYFGALASSIPPILLALTISPAKAILVASLYVLAHQIEGNVIQPLVVARAVKMHPAAVAVGVIAVDRLFGVVGLIVSVPILVTVTILIDELWTKPMEQNHGLSPPLATNTRPRSSYPSPRQRRRGTSTDATRGSGVFALECG